jgi:hypothetical protein
MKKLTYIERHNIISIGLLTSLLTFSNVVFAESGAKSMFADEGSTVMMNQNTQPANNKKSKAVPRHQSVNESSSDNEGSVNQSVNYSGLQYWIILQDVNGKEHQVNAKSHQFHSGDRIKLQVKSNSPGYLYILNQDSTGESSTLYPSKNQNAFIQAGLTYSIPERGAIRFDDVPGQEKITMLLSKFEIRRDRSSSSSNSNQEIQASYNANDCSNQAGSKGMFTEDNNAGDCVTTHAKTVSYSDCASSSAGSKGMFIDENIDVNCLRNNHSAGSAGSKGMFTEEDTTSAQPASYSVASTDDLDQGQVLPVQFYLTHR